MKERERGIFKERDKRGVGHLSGTRRIKGDEGNN